MEVEFEQNSEITAEKRSAAYAARAETVCHGQISDPHRDDGQH